MESETEKFAVRLEAHKENGARNFELYEEFSQEEIAETIRKHRKSFEQASTEQKRNLEVEAIDEVQRFRIWLEETKHLRPIEAHYCSVSLKSLLAGLPIGVEVALLFGAVLNKLSAHDGT